MASKPRRKSLRDRIWAILGIRRKPRVIRLFTEDQPQDHMQWMQEPQYLRYVQSLDSHLQPDSTPPTSSKEHSQQANNASSSTTNNLQKSSSFLSLDHWTPTAISPLELFYCATVAPYDVGHPLESQMFIQDRPGRTNCNRRKDESTFPVRNTKSDLDCASRFATHFDGSGMPFRDLQDEKPLSSQGLFLESGEHFVRGSVNYTKRKAGENYKVPVTKERLHGLRQGTKENLIDLGEAEKGNATENHEGASAKNECHGSNAGNERRQDSDVLIRFADNKLALNIKRSCKNVVIRCKNTPQCKEIPTDCNNRVKINLGKKEYIPRPNKNQVKVNIAGDCVILTFPADTEEMCPINCSQNRSYIKPSKDFGASCVSNEEHTDQGLIYIQDVMCAPCLSTIKEMQTDIGDSQGTRDIPVVLASPHVRDAAEKPADITENGEIASQLGCLQKADMENEAANACTTCGSPGGDTNAKITLDSPNFEGVIGNFDNTQEDVIANEDSNGLSEGFPEYITRGCEDDNDDISQCCVRLPPEGASSLVTADDSRLQVGSSGDVRELEDLTASTSQDSNIDQGADNLRGIQGEREVVGHPSRLSDDMDKKGEISKDFGGTNNTCFIGETGLVDVFLLMKTQHLNNSFGIAEVSGCSGQYRSAGRLQHHLKQAEKEIEACRLQLAHVNLCLSALRQEVTSVRQALTTLCHSTATYSGESSWLRTLEPSCYKKYLHIHSRSEAKHTRELVRNHIKALNDLEVLIYRKHLVLLQVLPGVQQDPTQQSKRGGMSAHQSQKPKRKEQTENNQEQNSNVIIEIVSVPAETYNCSHETSSGGSPANISTLISTSSEGGASSHYLTDTEI